MPCAMEGGMVRCVLALLATNAAIGTPFNFIAAFARAHVELVRPHFPQKPQTTHAHMYTRIGQGKYKYAPAKEENEEEAIGVVRKHMAIAKSPARSNNNGIRTITT